MYIPEKGRSTHLRLLDTGADPGSGFSGTCPSSQEVEKIIEVKGLKHQQGNQGFVAAFPKTLLDRGTDSGGGFGGTPPPPESRSDHSDRGAKNTKIASKFC